MKKQSIENNIVFNNDIKITNLSFKYPGNDKYTLKNINFSIKKNTVFGIQGDSGSGKTTLINLILGLIKPLEGSIKCDGQDILSNTESWQNQISYLPSNYSLLNEILKYNIAYGAEELTIDEKSVDNLIEKLELNSLSNQDDFNSNTLVDEDGKNFSAGQIQRICIARTLYRKSSI